MLVYVVVSLGGWCWFVGLVVSLSRLSLSLSLSSFYQHFSLTETRRTNEDVVRLQVFGATQKEYRETPTNTISYNAPTSYNSASPETDADVLF